MKVSGLPRIVSLSLIAHPYGEESPFSVPPKEDGFARHRGGHGSVVARRHGLMKISRYDRPADKASPIPGPLERESLEASGRAEGNVRKLLEAHNELLRRGSPQRRRVRMIEISLSDRTLVSADVLVNKKVSMRQILALKGLMQPILQRPPRSISCAVCRRAAHDSPPGPVRTRQTVNG